MYKLEVLLETSYLIAGIAVLSLIIVIVSIILITRDISRSHSYRQQMEKAKQYAEDPLHSREKLMLTISHDIRAPLSSIIGYIELLLRRHPHHLCRLHRHLKRQCFRRNSLWIRRGQTGWAA